MALCSWVIDSELLSEGLTQDISELSSCTELLTSFFFFNIRVSWCFFSRLNRMIACCCHSVSCCILVTFSPYLVLDVLINKEKKKMPQSVPFIPTFIFLSVLQIMNYVKLHGCVPNMKLETISKTGKELVHCKYIMLPDYLLSSSLQGWDCQLTIICVTLWVWKWHVTHMIMIKHCWKISVGLWVIEDPRNQRSFALIYGMENFVLCSLIVSCSKNHDILIIKESCMIIHIYIRDGLPFSQSLCSENK